VRFGPLGRPGFVWDGCSNGEAVEWRLEEEVREEEDVALERELERGGGEP
jgi:hypothetical protein